MKCFNLFENIWSNSGLFESPKEGYIRHSEHMYRFLLFFLHIMHNDIASWHSQADDRQYQMIL